MSWKGESEPNIKYCLGKSVELVQRFTTVQEFWTQFDGEPMEFEWNIFPGFTTLQLVDKVQEFMNKMGDPSQIPKAELSSCRFSMTSYGDLQTMNGNALLTPHL